MCVGRMVGVGFFLHFWCRFLALGRSQVAQAGAEHSWHRAGHAASPDSQEFGSQRQEPSHVLHVPGICPPAPGAPELCQTGKAQQEKFSFWGDGLGAGAAWRKHSGTGLLLPHHLSQREGTGESCLSPGSPAGGTHPSLVVPHSPCLAHGVLMPQQRLLQEFGFSHCLQSRISLQGTISELKLQTHPWLVLPSSLPELCPVPRLLDAGRGADGVCRARTRQVLQPTSANSDISILSVKGNTQTPLFTRGESSSAAKHCVLVTSSQLYFASCYFFFF